MVSKRKSGIESEAGTSKKSPEKAESSLEISKDESMEDNKKKKVKKSKANKEQEEKNEIEDCSSINNIKDEISEEDVSGVISLDTSEKNDSINYGLPNWPTEHISELIRRIENILPTDDQMAYKSRAEKLKWNEIAFDNYSGADCREMWEAISKRVRRFRILRELIDDAKIWLSKPWTNFYRGSKNNRHPDLPRRPLSSYMIYYLKMKDKVSEENPGLEMTDLSKHIAEMFKNISPKTKQKYNDLAAIERKEYEEKLEKFYRLHPEIRRGVSKHSVNVTHDNAPKKPPTPFKLFCEDKMKRVDLTEGYDKNTFLEKCKEQWRNMSDKKKVFWINWAFDKEAKYQDEIKKYMSEHPDFVLMPCKSVLTKEEKTIKERMEGKPEKPPNSAYSLFSRLMLTSEEVKTVNPKERMMVISQQWRSCSEVEKKEYADRVKHMLEQYKLQYAEYLESLPEDKRQEELLNSQTKRKRLIKPKTGEETGRKRTKKNAQAEAIMKNISKKATGTSFIKKNDSLYEGEPEPPPATPYLMFVKTYESSYPDRSDAEEVWKQMSEEQRSFHRRVLWDMKKVYIESYENFLKGLTQEELKQYSEWKKTNKLSHEDSENSSEESGSESNQECSSDSENDNKSPMKQEAADNSSDSE